MKLSIRSQLFLFSGVVFVMFVLLGLNTTVQARKLLHNLNNVAKTQMPAVRNMTLADMMHDGLRAIVYEFIYTAQNSPTASELKDFPAEALEKASDFRTYIAELEKLPLNPETMQAIVAAKPDLEAYINQSLAISGLIQSKNLEAARGSFGAFNEAFRALETRLETLGELIEKDALAENGEGTDILSNSLWVTLAAVVLMGVLSVFSTRTILRALSDFSSRMAATGAQFSVESRQIGAATMTLSESSTSAAASLEETVASLEELNSSTGQNSQNAQLACQLSQSGQGTANTGRAEMAALMESMQEISTNSKSMGEIINVIDDIAFQTNLLALNAAVEAARAGEQGRGFAVVADAVRTLAQRSADAAKNIKGMIEQSIQKIDEGSTVAQRNADVLVQIFESVQKIAALNDKISQASSTQAQTIEQVSRAMNLLDSSSQSNAASSEEIAISSQHLANQAAALKVLIEEFDRFIGALPQEKPAPLRAAA